MQARRRQRSPSVCLIPRQRSYWYDNRSAGGVPLISSSFCPPMPYDASAAPRAISGLSQLLRRSAWLHPAVWPPVLAPLPLAGMQLVELWDKPYYRFFPLFLVVVGYLAWRRWPEPSDAPLERVSILSRFWTGLSWILSLSAVLLFSPWLGMAALIAALGGAAARVLGSGFRERVLPVWLLLWLLMPPLPGGDGPVVAALRWGIWRTADAVLDRLGYLHWMVGDVLEVADRRFVLDDTFGPLNSPFAILSVAAILAVWRRRTLVPALLLIGSALSWFALAHILRFLAVPAVYVRYQVDLTAPPYATALLAATIGLMLILLYSTDQLLRPLRATTYAVRSGVVGTLNYLRRRIRLRRSKHRSRPARRQPDRPPPQPASPPTQPAAPLPPRWTFGEAARVTSCIVLATVQCWLLLAHSGSKSVADEPWHRQRLAAWNTALPEAIDEWTMVTLRDAAETPADVDMPGKWTYTTRAAEMAVTVDPVAANSETLVEHYRQEGWELFRYTRNLRGLLTAAPLAIAEAELVQPSGQAGLLIYTTLDSQGAGRSALGSWLATQLSATPLVALIRYWNGVSSGDDNSVYRVAIFARADDRLSRSERQRLRTALLEISQKRKGTDASG